MQTIKKTEKMACLRAGQSRPWVAKPLSVEPGQMRCSTHQSSSAGALSKRVLNWSQAYWCAAVPIWTAWNTEIETRIYDLAFSHNRCDPTSWKLLFSVLSIFRCSFKLPSFSAKARVLPLLWSERTGFAAQHSATARWHAMKVVTKGGSLQDPNFHPEFPEWRLNPRNFSTRDNGSYVV